jgi:hypothetical protein
MGNVHGAQPCEQQTHGVAHLLREGPAHVLPPVERRGAVALHEFETKEEEPHDVKGDDDGEPQVGGERFEDGEQVIPAAGGLAHCGTHNRQCTFGRPAADQAAVQRSVVCASGSPSPRNAECVKMVVLVMFGFSSAS